MREIELGIFRAAGLFGAARAWASGVVVGIGLLTIDADKRESADGTGAKGPPMMLRISVAAVLLLGLFAASTVAAGEGGMSDRRTAW